MKFSCTSADWCLPHSGYQTLPHLFNHGFDLPLLAEHHVIQVFDPFAEVCCFRPQLLGPGRKQRQCQLKHTLEESGEGETLNSPLETHGWVREVSEPEATSN